MVVLLDRVGDELGDEFRDGQRDWRVEVLFVGVPDVLPDWVCRVAPLDWEGWGDRLFLEEGFLFRGWVDVRVKNVRRETGDKNQDKDEDGVLDRLLDAGFWGVLLPPGLD